MIFSDLANVATNSEIRVNPSHTVFFFIILRLWVTRPTEY